MKRVNRILLSIGLICTIFWIVIIFGLTVVGDQYCEIRILNSGEVPMVIKTVRYANYDKTFTVDSVVLHPMKGIEIGSCISCSAPDSLDITYTAIGVYDAQGEVRWLNRTDLIQHLERQPKEGCITYLLQ